MQRHIFLWLVPAGFVLVLAALVAWIAIKKPRSGGPDPVALKTAQLLIEQAQAATDAGQGPAAVELLDSALALVPTDPTALVYRAHWAFTQAQPTVALGLLAKVGDEPATEAAMARYIEGMIAMTEHRARQALALFRRAAELDPTYRLPHERMLEIYAMQLRREEIRRELDALAALRPWKIEELVLYAIAGEKGSETTKGQSQVEMYLAADPLDTASSVALARYHLLQERHTEAAEVLAEVVAAQPDDFAARGLLAEAYLNAEQVAAAARCLAQAPPLRGAHSWYWRAAGRYWMKAGVWARAAAAFELAAAEAPDDLVVAYQLGLAWSRMQTGNQATAQLNLAHKREHVILQALRVQRNRGRKVEMLVDLLTDVGQTLLELNCPREALAWFSQALSRMPEHQACQQGYEIALARSQEPLIASAASHGQFSEIELHKALADADISTGAVEADISSAAGGAALALVDRHEEAGIDFTYFNGQTGLKYLVESMGGGVAVLDYDGDGWPDLYLSQGCKLPYDPASLEHTDRLLRNLGDGRFEDVTLAAGLEDNQYGQGVAVGDIDQDGDPDLLAANFGVHSFYRNNGDGTFTDVADTLGLDGEKWASSAAFADLDRDGDLDSYLLMYVDSLKVCYSDDDHVRVCDPNQFNAEQDVLLLNTGDGGWRDISESAGILAEGGKGLGIIVADFDVDSWPDVYIANDGTPNFLFQNLGGKGDPVDPGAAPAPPRFAEIGMISGTAVNDEGLSEAGMGIACADLDGNGMLDLHVTNFYHETNTLYLNYGDMQFVDATDNSRMGTSVINMLGFGTQAVDVDLDGRAELLVANGHIDDFRHLGQPWKMPPQLFWNSGGGTFQDVSTAVGPYFSGEYLGRGMARLDYDLDGRMDVVVVHQDHPLALLHNETPQFGHRLAMRLVSVSGNREAINARIIVEAGGTTQKLEICGGDGFFSSNDRRQIIGLGTAEEISKLEIHWQGGNTTRLESLPVDCELTLIEGRPPIIKPLPVASDQ